MTLPLYKVDEGDDIELKCHSFGEVKWYYREGNEVKWYYSKGNKVPIALPTSGKVYKLNIVTTGDKGYYICYGKYPFNAGSFLSRIFLEVFCMFVNIILSVVS